MIPVIYQIGTISQETKSTKRELKSIGGISGYIMDLTNHLLLRSFKVVVIGKVYNYQERYGSSYIEIQRKVTSTSRFLFRLLFHSFFISIPRNSVIHAHRPDHLAAFLLFKKRVSVLTLHGQQRQTVNLRKSATTRFIYSQLEDYAIKKANAIIAVDNVTRDLYSSLYPGNRKKLVTIPTGVNLRMFFPMNRGVAREKYGFSDNDKIIIYVGRIEPPKRLDIVISAINHLVKRSLDYKLVIVGDGVLMKEIQNLVYQKKLIEHVAFLGIRKRIELPELYSIANTSVLYSENEGSPLSVKESLACGIPVVANPVGDIPELIKNGINGYITENMSELELASKLDEAIELGDIKRVQCVNSIKEFSSDIVNEKVIDIYWSVINDS